MKARRPLGHPAALPQTYIDGREIRMEDAELRTFREAVARAARIGVDYAASDRFSTKNLEESKRGRMTEDALERLLDRPNVSVLAVTIETTSRFVEIMRHLKANGTPIPTNDVWIAAGALERNADLITNDVHFSNVPMIRVIH